MACVVDEYVFVNEGIYSKMKVKERWRETEKAQNDPVVNKENSYKHDVLEKNVSIFGRISIT